MLLSVANLKKTINYLKKNGPEDTCYAALPVVVHRVRDGQELQVSFPAP